MLSNTMSRFEDLITLALQEAYQPPTAPPRARSEVCENVSHPSGPPGGLGVPGQPKTGCEYYVRAEMVLMAASRHSNLRACCRIAASSKLRVCACCMARARPSASAGSYRIPHSGLITSCKC